ncbi:MAG: amino-acid N-acetyltransferase, partial [Polyangiaceae bacterium]|nr:amino-acid N-acetyltransferase [Polyangiaceae bacterium]
MIEKPPDAFVDWFRASAPYIHAHRGRTFVLVFGGEAMKSSGLRSLVHDIALLSSLGVRLVVCAGARPQIDERIATRGKKSRFIGGRRVTDKLALECAKEAAGTNRLELEALLSMALPNSPMAGARMRVVAGNFVSARPVGVIDGVDYQ